MEAGLGVVVLPREAEVVGDPLNANVSIPEGGIGCRPNYKTARRDDLLRSTLMVVLVPVVLAAYFDKERIGSPLGLRRPAISPQLNSRCVILTDQTFIRVYKISPNTVNVLEVGKRTDDPS